MKPSRKPSQMQRSKTLSQQWSRQSINKSNKKLNRRWINTKADNSTINEKQCNKQACAEAITTQQESKNKQTIQAIQSIQAVQEIQAKQTNPTSPTSESNQAVQAIPTIQSIQASHSSKKKATEEAEANDKIKASKASTASGKQCKPCRHVNKGSKPRIKPALQQKRRLTRNSSPINRLSNAFVEQASNQWNTQSINEAMQQ